MARRMGPFYRWKSICWGRLGDDTDGSIFGEDGKNYWKLERFVCFESGR